MDTLTQEPVQDAEAVPFTEPDIPMTDAQADAEMEAGYQGGAPSPSDPSQAEGSATPDAVQSPEPQAVVQLTKKEYDELKALSTALSDYQATVNKRLDSNFGKLGNLEQIIRSIQDSSAAGEPVSDEDIAELKSEFPEVAQTLLPALNRVVGKMRGTRKAGASAQPSQPATPQPSVDELIRQVETRANMRIMTAIEPDWESTIRKPEFTAWLEKQPEDYRTKVQDTEEPSVLQEALSAFKAQQPKPTPATPTPKPSVPSARQRTLAAAVTPKGDADLGGSSGNAEDEMEAGYKQSKGFQL